MPKNEVKFYEMHKEKNLKSVAFCKKMCYNMQV